MLHSVCMLSQKSIGGIRLNSESWKVRYHTQNAPQHVFRCFIWILKSNCCLKTYGNERPIVTTNELSCDKLTNALLTDCHHNCLGGPAVPLFHLVTETNTLDSGLSSYRFQSQFRQLPFSPPPSTPFAIDSGWWTQCLAPLPTLP